MGVGTAGLVLCRFRPGQAGIAPQQTLRPTEEGTVLANTRRSRGQRPRDGAASAAPGAGESTASATVAVDHGETAVAEPPPTIEETSPRPRITSWAELWSRIHAILARDAVWVPLTVFLLSRAYVFLLGAIAMQINLALPPVAALQYFMPEMAGAAHYLLQPWRNWDGHWYALVVLKGYGYHEAVTAFFPLYPALLGVGNWLLDGQIELAGVIISNVAFLGALVLLYQLLIVDFDRAVVRRALLYIALFPTAYYFSAVYSESLFLLVSVGCLLAARRDRIGAGEDIDPLALAMGFVREDAFRDHHTAAEAVEPLDRQFDAAARVGDLRYLSLDETERVGVLGVDHQRGRDLARDRARRLGEGRVQELTRG